MLSQQLRESLETEQKRSLTVGKLLCDAVIGVELTTVTILPQNPPRVELIEECLSQPQRQRYPLHLDDSVALSI